jgi:hypothetical protein
MRLAEKIEKRMENGRLRIEWESLEAGGVHSTSTVMISQPFVMDWFCSRSKLDQAFNGDIITH